MRSNRMPKIRAVTHVLRATVAALALTLLLPASATPSWAGSDAARGTIVAKVDGMSCPFCTYGLRKELLTIHGVKDVQVSLRQSQATLETDPGATVTDDQIREAIHDAGFSPGVIMRK